MEKFEGSSFQPRGGYIQPDGNFSKITQLGEPEQLVVSRETAYFAAVKQFEGLNGIISSSRAKCMYGRCMRVTLHVAERGLSQTLRSWRGTRSKLPEGRQFFASRQSRVMS